MRINQFFKPMMLSLVAIAFIAFTHGTANADEVFISGYSNGAFNGVPPNTSATQTASLLGLTYVNSTFSGTTASGFLAFGGNPIAPPTQNVNNFGAFALSTAPNVYDGNTFTLRITFVAPEGIAGSNTTLFTATLMGTVRSETDGGVFVDFNNTPILFTFNDLNCQPTTVMGQQTTCGSGSFLLSLNDVSINPGQVASITGNIMSAQQTAIPEPTSMLLLGTGLAGVAGAVRRRMKRQ